VDFIAQYGIFLAKTVTLVLAIFFLVVGVVSVGQRHKKHEKRGYIETTSLNDKFQDMADAMCAAVFSIEEYKAYCKAEEKKDKLKQKSEKERLKQKDAVSIAGRSRVFVIDFVGDISASACEPLAEQVTAILTQATPADEVVVRLESSGGMVHSYGLAASQLQRIRDKAIPLTICVDKVAASGGYMMACIAHKLLAAPFAVLGSIGVVAQIPNVHRLLKKHDIDYELFTAGEYKRTVTVLGENTEKGKQKFQQEIAETHDLFKSFVSDHRPSLDMDLVATGETWFGKKALEKNLVDAIQTSDDYLYARHHDADVFQVSWVEKHTLAEKLGLATESAVDRLSVRWLERLEGQRFFIR